MTVSLSALKARAVVLDVEGTTTPIEFVYQVLFPYARSHAAVFLEGAWESDACRAAIARLRAEHARDNPESVAHGFGAAEAVAYVHRLMDEDRKSPGLKALQGLIFREGFERGELRGQVYGDVPAALARWRARSLDVYIYSSGSVLAQQLLFGSTDAGDLTAYLSGYFDTDVGPKLSPESYGAIAARIEVPIAEIVFVSDVVAELDAASVAGMTTILCDRGENGGATTTAARPLVGTFDEIAD